MRKIFLSVCLIIALSLSVILISCSPDGNTESSSLRRGELVFTLIEGTDSYSVKVENRDWISSVIIPSTYNGKPVISIEDYAFCYCENLVEIIIPASVISIGKEAFTGCSSLTAITIPNSVTSIELEAFSHCTGLTSITIQEGVTSIGWDAFMGCSSLTTIHFLGTVSQWNAITKGPCWDLDTGSYTITYAEE